MSLKEKTISGVIWTFSQQLGVQSINFVVQIVLARMLMPEAFGLIAMIQIFMYIGEALMDGGMTSSLIRTVNPDHKDFSTVFFINIISSLLIYCAIFFSAPAISHFFEQPLLTPVIRVYTLSFVIQALVGVQVTKLTKEMKFKTQMMMQIPSTIIGGITGVSLAYSGMGVWSLVWMHITTTTLFMLQLWFKSGWRPSFVFDKDKFKYHFNFGYKLTFSALLTSIYNNSFTLVIGKLFSATQLGFYNQANTLRMFPVRNLTSALQKVTYPVFSSIQNDDDKLKHVFKRITALVFFIICPVMLMLVLVANPLFRFVLTDKWLPAVPYFQILCLSAVFYPLSMYNLNIILAKGRSDLHFKLELLKKGISILFLLLIIPYGIMGAVYASGISMLIHAFVNSLYSGRLINYPISQQFRDIIPTFSISIVSWIICYGFLFALKGTALNSDVLMIIAGVVLYSILYCGISYVTKRGEIIEIKKMISEVVNKLNRK